jgi:hypothetical protein
MGFSEDISIVYGHTNFDRKVFKVTFYNTDGNVGDITFNTSLLEFEDT